MGAFSYSITLNDGTKERVTAMQVGITSTGGLMFSDNDQTFKSIYAPGSWQKVELSPIHAN